LRYLFPALIREQQTSFSTGAMRRYRRRIDKTGSISFRWWIAAMLFASTTINYIDRQTLNVLAPYLKRDFHWSNSDFALIVIAFRAAYTIFQLAGGPLIDRLGTRRGLSLAVLWYSLVAIATSAASGLKSLAAFRFMLGAGEAANWPGRNQSRIRMVPGVRTRNGGGDLR
jgi:MFS family permease